MQNLNELREKSKNRQAEINSHLAEVDKVLESAHAEVSQITQVRSNLKEEVSILTKEKDTLKSDIKDLQAAKEEDEAAYSKTIKDQEDKLDRLKSLNIKAQQEYIEIIKKNNKEKDDIELGNKDLEDEKKALSIKKAAIKRDQLQLLEDRRRFEAEKSPFDANI